MTTQVCPRHFSSFGGEGRGRLHETGVQPSKTGLEGHHTPEACRTLPVVLTVPHPLRGQHDLREYASSLCRASLCLSFPTCKLGKLKVFCLCFFLQPHSVCPSDSSEETNVVCLPLSPGISHSPSGQILASPREERVTTTGNEKKGFCPGL